ncbi:MAG: 50S ribosomal protein L25/general stress protein Ctc [Nocardioidaceae bacterium]
MSETTLQAESRTEFGKGAARRIRRADKVPAVLYGHGSDPLHVSLPGHDLMMALKNANALLTIVLDGKTQLALPKQVQRDPIKGFIEHADLLIVRRGEKVVVDIAVTVVGEAASEALVVTETASIPVEAEATHIPESIEVNVDGMVPGDHVTAADLSLPEGARVQLDPEHLVVNVVAAPTAAEVEADLAEAEADAGIERDASDAELEVQAEEAAAGGETSDGDQAGEAEQS